LLDDPRLAREWIDAHGAAATLSELHALVVRAREREHAESVMNLRLEWMHARGAAHHTLARRQSLVGLYDLRETFETATKALPQGFLSAASAIGNASCLEPLAHAWSASPKDLEWRHQLAMTAGTIVRREKLNGRSALVKRLRSQWPGFV
jgi:hypothetical protein